MKKLKLCRTMLCTALTALLLAAAAFVIQGYARGFTYTYMMQGIKALMALLIVPFVLGVTTAVLARKYASPETEGSCRAVPYREKEKLPREKNILRGAVIMLSVLMIVLGIINGGLWDVLVKAINICTECIGLG